MEQLKPKQIKEIKKEKIKYIKDEVFNYVNSYDPNKYKYYLISKCKEEYLNHLHLLINNIKKLKKNEIYDQYSELKSFINQFMEFEKFKFKKETLEVCHDFLDILAEYHPEKINDFGKILTTLNGKSEIFIINIHFIKANLAN